MTSPLVSVVVPTHNRSRMLPRLLASVLAQDVEELELIVVDDGSADDTQDVLRRCSDPRLRVLHHPDARGVSRARNTGTAAASARWVAWCDDDDVWSPEKLRLQIEAVERSEGARWCTGGVAYVGPDLDLRRITLCPADGDVSATLLHRNVITSGSGILADRALALSVGGFDPGLSIFADWHMWARLAQVAPLAVVDLPLVGYVDHPGGMSHDRRKLLAEFVLLRERLGAIAAENGKDVDIDLLQVGGWMLRQQVSAGHRLDTVVLPWQLLRRRMMLPSRAVPYSLLGAALPGVLVRHWTGRWVVPDRVNLEYAQRWLAQARATLPSVTTADTRTSA